MRKGIVGEMLWSKDDEVVETLIFYGVQQVFSLLEIPHKNIFLSKAFEIKFIQAAMKCEMGEVRKEK